MNLLKRRKNNMSMTKEQWHDFKLSEIIGMLKDKDMDTYILNHTYILKTLEALKHER
jgi:hypothetical protein